MNSSDDLRVDLFISTGLTDEHVIDIVYLGQSLALVMKIDQLSAGRRIDAICELQTASRKLELLSLKDEIVPDDGILLLKKEYEVKDVGVHVVTVTVQGHTPHHFKFNAVSPFQLRTNINTASEPERPINSILYYLEAQLTNCCTEAFNEVTVRFVPTENVTIMDNDTMTFEIKPRCTLQCLFSLSVHQMPIDDGHLGRIDIRWKSPSGVVGHLQTAPITPPPPSTIEAIQVVYENRELAFGDPVELRITIRNNTNRNISDIRLGIDLEMVLSSSSTFIPVGEPFINIGDLPGLQRKLVKMTVLPMAAGSVQIDEFFLSYTDEWVKHRRTPSAYFYICS